MKAVIGIVGIVVVGMIGFGGMQMKRPTRIGGPGGEEARVSGPVGPGYRFPWAQAGLTERQAAAHLISRFTYGATPGEVDAVVETGLEKWFGRQLEAQLPDDSLEHLLSRYDALGLSNTEVAEAYPRNGQVVRMAIRDGVIDKDSVKTDRKEYRELLVKYMEQKGLKRQQELFRQFFCQNILRAAYSSNQLQEVMTDFWFNHFNVSITKNDCAEFIPAYERDVIRPNALGRFNELLLETAKSPAMLYYLDNFSSSAPLPENQTMGENRGAGEANGRDGAGGTGGTAGNGDSASMAVAAEAGRAEIGRASKAEGRDRSDREGRQQSGGQARRNRGINENYAREVMELHTMGVDGGYTQQDVTQAARVLTGWGVYPMGDIGRGAAANFNRLTAAQVARRGFVRDGDFFFNANRHDKGEKVVLGHVFSADGGYEEGVQLLELLAHHPSTARFISRKIAVRFVSDDPPQSLIDKMAKTFLGKNGDIRQVLITMVTSPEFWAPDALREKTKSPFELAIGAVRGMHAVIYQPMQLYNWVAKMGERKYYYQAPTGFPDKGAYWINTGSLLNRMNFGLALAAGKIPGIGIDLLSLNSGHEPESAQAALVAYGHILLPERNLDATVKRLTPLLNDPSFSKKVEEASARTAASDSTGIAVATSMEGDQNAMLGQVVGILIGSPEYQRR